MRSGPQSLHAAAAAWGKPARPAPKVLIVDDDVLSLMLLETILASFGAVVATASRGVEALELLGNHAFDLLLLDVRMPDMSGLELAAAVRSTPGYNRAVPIVAVTGETPKSLAEYAALGFDGGLEKPISFGAMRSCLERWTAERPDGEAAQGSRSFAPAQPPTRLIC